MSRDIRRKSFLEVGFKISCGQKILILIADEYIRFIARGHMHTRIPPSKLCMTNAVRTLNNTQMGFKFVYYFLMIRKHLYRFAHLNDQIHQIKIIHMLTYLES